VFAEERALWPLCVRSLTGVWCVQVVLGTPVKYEIPLFSPFMRSLKASPVLLWGEYSTAMRPPCLPRPNIPSLTKALLPQVIQSAVIHKGARRVRRSKLYYLWDKRDPKEFTITG
jgi:hypothetical protein